MKKYTYTVLLAPKADGVYRYRAVCPALPGCRAYGNTRTEAIQNIRISMIHKLEALEATGIPRGASGATEEFFPNSLKALWRHLTVNRLRGPGLRSRAGGA